METLKLRNGAEEPKQLVAITMTSLRKLLEQHPLAFYDLTMKCRDRSYALFGNNSEVLMGYNLIQNMQGDVHNSIRNVVLSAVQGEGLDMGLGSPVAQ